MPNAKKSVEKQIVDEIDTDSLELEIEEDVVPRFKLDTNSVRHELKRIN